MAGSDKAKSPSPARSPAASPKGSNGERSRTASREASAGIVTTNPDTPLEAATGADADDDDDEFDPVEGIDIQSNASTSATSSIYAHTQEHGRRYYHFKNGRYPIPGDDQEQDREDMKHAMMLELMDGELFYAPVEDPQSILDVGTGTGIWAIEGKLAG